MMSMILERAGSQMKRESTDFDYKPAGSQKSSPKKQKLGVGTCDDCGDKAR